MVVFLNPKTCTRDGCGFTAPEECFPSNGQRKDGSRRRHSYCPPCKRQIEREYRQAHPEEMREKARRTYRRLMADPGGRERLRQQARERKRQEAQTEEGRARQAASARRYRARKLAEDPEAYRAKMRGDARERRERLRREDPEAFAALLERERQQREERLRRPGARRRERQDNRMAAALRREKRTGQLEPTVRRRVQHSIDDEHGGRLPVRPLLAHIEALIDRETRPWEGDLVRVEGGAVSVDRQQEHVAARAQAVAAVLGRIELSQRTLYAWGAGERREVYFDLADSILTRLGESWLLYELWPELGT